MGSRIDPDYVPDFDAPVVERIQNQGGVVIGKTNTPEYGWKGETTNLVTGSTHNPWQHGLTPGGSSGGAAAAVAAGMGPMAQGSDGAGSIRIPAAFSGIYGIKPTYGFVPQYPASAVPDVSHMGPMTRTVADSALLLDVMAGEDRRDRVSWTPDRVYSDLLDEPTVAGLRIAWSPDLGYAPVEPEVVEIAEGAAKQFESLGAIVESADPGLADPWDMADLIWSSGMASIHADNLDEVAELIDPGRLEMMRRHEGKSALDLAMVQPEKSRYYDGMRKFFETYDLLLTPTLPCTAFSVGQTDPGTIAGKSVTYLGWTAFTYPFNLTGMPAATVPAGLASNGLPVGLQIVAPRYQDALVLQASAAFEAAVPWNDVWPPAALN